MNESAPTVQSHPKILVILYGNINNIKQQQQQQQQQQQWIRH